MESVVLAEGDVRSDNRISKLAVDSGAQKAGYVHAAAILLLEREAKIQLTLAFKHLLANIIMRLCYMIQ